MIHLGPIKEIQKNPLINAQIIVGSQQTDDYPPGGGEEWVGVGTGVIKRTPEQKGGGGGGGGQWLLTSHTQRTFKPPLDFTPHPP